MKSSRSRPVGAAAAGASVPGAPRDLEAIFARQRSGSLEVDLSWAISGAGNLTGYNVYRSQQPEGPGVRLNRLPLAAPEFRDTTVAAGISYRYSVTAVGAAGTESKPSAPVTVNVPGKDGE